MKITQDLRADAERLAGLEQKSQEFLEQGKELYVPAARIGPDSSDRTVLSRRRLGREGGDAQPPSAAGASTWMTRLAIMSLVSGGVGGHVRSGRMRLQRLHALPFLQHDERVRAEFGLEAAQTLGVNGRAVFDAALLGMDGGHVGPELPQDRLHAGRVWR